MYVDGPTITGLDEVIGLTPCITGAFDNDDGLRTGYAVAVEGDALPAGLLVLASLSGLLVEAGGVGIDAFGGTGSFIGLPSGLGTDAGLLVIAEMVGLHDDCVFVGRRVVVVGFIVTVGFDVVVGVCVGLYVAGPPITGLDNVDGLAPSTTGAFDNDDHGLRKGVVVAVEGDKSPAGGLVESSLPGLLLEAGGVGIEALGGTGSFVGILSG